MRQSGGRSSVPWVAPYLKDPTMATTTPKKKTGRPRIEIDKKRFEELCASQATLEDIASDFGCSEDTIERWVKREYKKPFADIFPLKRKKGLNSLRARMYQIAMDGNVTMLIYLSKNWLGMTDKPAAVVDQEDTDSYFDEAGL